MPISLPSTGKEGTSDDAPEKGIRVAGQTFAPPAEMDQSTNQLSQNYREQIKYIDEQICHL
ncbi:MAG: hypothetical protein LBU42_01255 [Prevotellaceae bacterium]|jgi:hypothetical protein|nr:hypothetical protein [Prevotellaceae bacterium]